MKEFNIEERVEKARRLFKEGGYNCCQAVVLAYNDVFGIDDTMAAALSSGFGGGMGRMREVCGSVSGMVLLAGLLKPAGDPSDKAARTGNYALVQEVAGEFKAMNGSIICKELLGLTGGPVAEGKGIHGIPESPTPSDRTPEYYKKRPCEELVGISARIIGEKILQFIHEDKNNL
jgi:C_GCAxxG_C_C family probable redox protein